MNIIIKTIRQVAQKLYREYKRRNTNPKPQEVYRPAYEPPKPTPQPQKPSITVDISETPNPQACKYDVSAQVSEKSFSFSASDMPKEHPLASDLLSIEGVISVFGVHTFITATKDPSASWDNIHAKVSAVLQKHLA